METQDWASLLDNPRPSQPQVQNPMRDSDVPDHNSLPVQFIDTARQRHELQSLRSLNQKFASELFESCCELQRDSSAVDLRRVSTLVFTLELISKRRKALEAFLNRQSTDPRD